MEIEICAICKQKIFLDKDNYVRITDYRKGEFFMESFYHTNCYNEKITGSNKRMQKMDALLSKVGEMVGVKPAEEFYEIPA